MWVPSLGGEDATWRRACNPLQYPCLENPHGQRSLAGYSPWSRKVLDTTEATYHICQGEKKKKILILSHATYWVSFSYFRKGPFFGLACFANMPVESELERGARMKSVGILSPSYTLLYRHMHFLENQVRCVAHRRGGRRWGDGDGPSGLKVVHPSEQ